MVNRIIVIKKTKMMYGWSKYGGGRKGLVREEPKEWCCQSCGERYSKEMPGYFFPYDINMREFVKICGSCQNKAAINLIQDLKTLLKHCRKPKNIFDNLNT